MFIMFFICFPGKSQTDFRGNIGGFNSQKAYIHARMVKILSKNRFANSRSEGTDSVFRFTSDAAHANEQIQNSLKTFASESPATCI